MINTYFSKGDGKMKKTKILSFVLLFAFLSFLYTQYTGENTKALNLHENKAVIAFNEANQDSPSKDVIKKHPFILTDILQLFVCLSLIFILFSSLFFQARSKRIFFTPIFYQANYVIRIP